jgi:hypothetical protein
LFTLEHSYYILRSPVSLYFVVPLGVSHWVGLLIAAVRSCTPTQLTGSRTGSDMPYRIYGQW